MSHFIAFAGNIGAGKSTGARILADALECRLLEEPVVDNRFLAPYYKDMKRWSFTLQMEFLLRRIEHHKQVEVNGHRYVQDRTLLEDPEIFAKYLHGLGNMTDQELELYFDYCRMLMPEVCQPDCIVLLDCDDVDVLLSRIESRGRREEKGIPRAFLEGLAGYYRTFAHVCQEKYGIPTLRVDVSQFDIRTDDGKAKFLQIVLPFVQEAVARKG